MPGEKDFRKTRAQIVRGRTALLANTRDEIVRLLKSADAQIRAILAAQPTDYQRWALPRLQQEIPQALAQFGEQAGARLSTASGQAWQLGQDLVDEPLNAGGIRVAASLQHLDTAQLSAMRAFMTERIKDVGLAAANKINAELGLVMIGAQGPSDAIGKVAQILGEQSRARATTIVRTELSRAFSVASFERIGQAAAVVPGMQKQWRKSGKLHPRFYHDLADGQVRDVGEPFHFGDGATLMFPHDPAGSAAQTINCGCVMLPFKSDWKVSQPKRSPGGLDMGPSLRELLPAAA